MYRILIRFKPGALPKPTPREVLERELKRMARIRNELDHMLLIHQHAPSYRAFDHVRQMNEDLEFVEIICDIDFSLPEGHHEIQPLPQINKTPSHF